MSRAGKFIPGGANRPSGDGPSGNRTGPIRAPAPGAPPEETPPVGGKKPTGKGSSLIKPVAKKQRLPIVIMSGIVCCMLVSFGWYELAVIPVQRQIAAARQREADIQKQMEDERTKFAKEQAEQNKHQAAVRATLTVDTKPTGVNVIVGSFHKQTPATFNDLPVGTATLFISADGYEDYKQEVTVNADQPTDLGVIQLVMKAGTLSLTSPQTEVEYSLTGPNDYAHQGKVPDKVDKVPPGDYQLTAWQHDWKLSPETVTIHDQENVQKEIKFPYGNVAISSVPSGATVRQGHTVLGQTPLNLPQLHPTTLHLSVDLPPYTIQRFDLEVADFGNIQKQVTLKQGKDFLASNGMPMIWIPEGHFWAGKYEVRQSDFETVAGSNPSFFRRPDRPVEQISWEGAMAFCEKLNQFERKAGKLPAGYHYALPMESQWSLLTADADMAQAPMSRSDNSLSSTLDAGASEPNKYGIYDTLGNVWEWCLDPFDDRGNHSLRGGSWLSSRENFPSSDTRNGGAPKYSDRFTGFRVVLVPDQG